MNAELIERDGGALSRIEETLVALSNGCICCTLRDDLLSEVRRLAEEQRFDYVLRESTGISEPVPVAQTFVFADEEGVPLAIIRQHLDARGGVALDRCLLDDERLKQIL